MAESKIPNATKFIPGLDLCQSFYEQAVGPILKKHFPNMPYSAALIGNGSEVLGYDNELSSDHHWGPRVMLFLQLHDYLEKENEITQALSEHLPREFQGYPTSFTSPVAGEITQMLDWNSDGPINHRCEIHSIESYFVDNLGLDPNAPMTAVDWLTVPEQKLLSVTKGRVFHDALNLEAQRSKLSYYPHEVWLYLLSCAWSRIEQEEHLMGRAGSVGDEIGAAIIASRLVRDLMRLCFLMEKQYAPYPKWFGTAFNKLAAAGHLVGHFNGVLSAPTWRQREEHLVPAYEYVAEQHNNLKLTEPMPTKIREFHNRPFRVISMGTFSAAIRDKITDPVISAIAAKRPIGSIDQFSDNTDLLSAPELRQVLKRLYA